MIKFKCSACGKRLGSSEQFAGKKGKCPACKNIFVIPSGEPSVYGPVEIEGQDEKTGLWKEIVHEKTGIALRLIPAGEFDMGSPDSEMGRDGDEGPVHRVKISRPFHIGKYEVTQGQWRGIMGNNPSYFNGNNLPVEHISWENAKEFVRKAGDGLRLPTEAEWEYACRAGTKTPFNTGNNITTDQANYAGKYPYAANPKGEYRGKTTPVGAFKPNAWGLYDMHGNVWEWCSDGYGEKYYDECKNGVTDPQGPPVDRANLVVRGGSWNSGAGAARSAGRYEYHPGYSYNSNYYVGLRVVVAANVE